LANQAFACGNAIKSPMSPSNVVTLMAGVAGSASCEAARQAKPPPSIESPGKDDRDTMGRSGVRTDDGKELRLRAAGDVEFEGIADRSELKVGMTLVVTYREPADGKAPLGFDITELVVERN
jgi:hypothetical protein